MGALPGDLPGDYDRWKTEPPEPPDDDRCDACGEMACEVCGSCRCSECEGRRCVCGIPCDRWQAALDDAEDADVDDLKVAELLGGPGPRGRS